MLIESKIKIGPDSMFSIHQANFKTSHLRNKIALIQFQRNSIVNQVLSVDQHVNGKKVQLRN